MGNVLGMVEEGTVHEKNMVYWTTPNCPGTAKRG